MKITDTKERIKELMQMYGLNQSDFCERTKINKSALSNYLNGSRIPRQDQIAKIADAFKISASWVMGYDVPMIDNNVPGPDDLPRPMTINDFWHLLNNMPIPKHNTTTSNPPVNEPPKEIVTHDEYLIIERFRKLRKEDKEYLLKMLDLLYDKREKPLAGQMKLFDFGDDDKNK